MENTYNYFFSSTPQVLAGILGLFGVFIVFKISDINDQLKSIKADFIRELALNKRKLFESEGSELEKMITREDFNGLVAELDAIMEATRNKEGKEKIEGQKKKIETIYSRHIEANKFKKELIRKTISASKITLLNIAYCLVMLIFGFWISQCTLWSMIAFLPAVALSILIFYKLISIIKYSFED